MPSKITITVDTSLPAAQHPDWGDLCGSLASIHSEPVTLAIVDTKVVQAAWDAAVASEAPDLRTFEPKPPVDAPMSSAPFVWEEGTELPKPKWGSMWESFCELALYGGPPHRGLAQTLTAESPAAEVEEDIDAVEEIRRGIWETTGLYSEPVPPNWLAVKCASPTMAAWLCATIILENVEARSEGDILYVPASADFHLKDQVKSVITVVAKCNHYWQAHMGLQVPI
jgi:hypothetical protein